MLDFASQKRPSSRNRGQGWLIAAICVIGLVGYALLENTIAPAFAGPSDWLLTETTPT